MGNCNFKTEFETDNVVAVTKNHFQFHYVIGKGGFGKVWKVEMKKTNRMFAMKEMLKCRIISKRSVTSVMNERKLLSSLKHPFLVNMHYAFQDRENLYLVMDLLNGGDLRYHISKHRKFTEEQTRFFLACLLLCLEYVHNKGVIHRDIKPENLVFDSTGYLRLTDFGIARIWNPENAKDTSGTPGYMAPEVMCRQNHGVAVDYFAIGVIGYECMFGKRPYYGKTRKDIRNHILSKQVQIKRHEIPKGWSIEAADFINKTLQRKPINRLGLNGPEEVKNHPWFKDYPFDDLLNNKIPSPFIPPNEDNFDHKYANDNWKDENTEQMKENALLLRRPSVQALFNGYYHDDSLAAMNGTTRGLISTDKNTKYQRASSSASNSSVTRKRNNKLNSSMSFHRGSTNASMSRTFYSKQLTGTGSNSSYARASLSSKPATKN
jgi:serine/threonine protein kinase